MHFLFVSSNCVLKLNPSSKITELESRKPGALGSLAKIFTVDMI